MSETGSRTVDTAPRCDDDFYCGECPDCLTGDHPENRPRYAALQPAEASDD